MPISSISCKANSRRSRACARCASALEVLETIVHAVRLMFNSNSVPQQIYEGFHGFSSGMCFVQIALSGRDAQYISASLLSAREHIQSARALSTLFRDSACACPCDRARSTRALRRAVQCHAAWCMDEAQGYVSFGAARSSVRRERKSAKSLIARLVAAAIAPRPAPANLAT